MLRDLVLLGLTSFFTDASSELLNPLLPLFIITIGGNVAVLGLIAGLGEFFSYVIRVLSGYLSDRKGSRLPYVFLGYTISAISKFFYIFSFHWLVVLICRLADRTGKGIRDAPRDALIANISASKVRGKAFAIHRTLDTLGGILGALLALLLFSYLKLGFLYIFIIASFLAFLSLIPLKFVRDVKFKPNHTFFLQNIRRLPKKLIHAIAILSLFSLVNFNFMIFVWRSTTLLNLPLEKATAFTLVLYLLFNTVYAVFSIPAGLMYDKFGRKRIIVAGYFVYAIMCLIFLSANSFSMLLLAFFMFGVFKALVEGNQKAFVSGFVSAELEGTAIGLFYTTIGTVMFIGNVLAGVIWQQIGANLIFTVAAIVASIAALLLLIFKES